MSQAQEILLQSADAILQICKAGENDALTKQGIIVALGDFLLSAQKVETNVLIDSVTGALAAADS